MAKILLYWGWDADLIECPEFIPGKIDMKLPRINF